MSGLSVWYDEEGDYLELIQTDEQGHFVDLGNGVFERVDEDGEAIGIAVLDVLLWRCLDSLEGRRVEANDTGADLEADLAAFREERLEPWRMRRCSSTGGAGRMPRDQSRGGSQ